jgi:putative transposase
MKVLGLQAALYRGASLASRVNTAAANTIRAERCNLLARWHTARRQGLSAAQAAAAVGVSRATLYRWQKCTEPRSRRPRRVRASTWRSTLMVTEVEALRQRYPMWGKRKIAVLLRRQGRHISVSTAGRILRYLMQRRRVTPVPLLRRNPGPRRFRRLGQHRHAHRLPKGTRPQEPGQLVQIDTLFVNLAPGKSIKHFTAYDPLAKWTTALVASNATASRAAALLDRLLAACPFPIRGIQVDGGSEFMAQFEQLCAAKKLQLFVLPPKRPQLNGAVERAQSTSRYEFYACHHLPTRLHDLQQAVDRFAHHFNHIRPHQALGDLTPAEYLASRSQTDASHMC